MKHNTYEHSIALLKSGAADMLSDKYFNEILNEDKILQIGSKIYRVNVEDEKVLILPADKIEEYNDLLIENESNEEIKRFSTSDDVLDEVRENEAASRGCGGIGGGWRESNIVNLDDAGNIKFQARVRFFRAGIWFRVTARCDYTPAYSEIVNLSLEINGPQAWARRRPCGPSNIIVSPPGVKRTGFSHSYLWEFHSGTRSLNGLYLFARAKASITPPGQVTVTKYTSWTGINANSPY